MLDCADFSLLDEVALPTAEAFRGGAAATADAVRPVSGGVTSWTGAGVFAVGVGTGADAAFAGVAVVFFAVAGFATFDEADFGGAAFAGAALTGTALADADFAGAAFAGAAFTGAAFEVAAFAGALVAGALVTGALLADFVAALAGSAFFAAALVTVFDVFVAGLAAAPIHVFTPATTVSAVFTSPAPPFLAVLLAAAEL